MSASPAPKSRENGAEDSAAISGAADLQRTSAVLLTPPGRGAVATVLVCGPRASEIVGRLFSPRIGRWPGAQPWGKIRFGQWRSVGSDRLPPSDEPPPAGEEVVVAALDPTRVEVHCHGGVAAPQAVLNSLAAQGCTVVDWPDWIAAHTGDPIRAEASEALSHAPTERTAAILLDQFQGALRQACTQIEEHLSAGNLESARAQVAELLAWVPLGQHLTEPWRVVLAGPPNVGKSSLINRLLGFERAIVHDSPGTTRDVVTAAASLSGWPVELSDTAGLRDAGDSLEAAGVALAETQLAAADAVVLVADIRQSQSDSARRLLAGYPAAIVVYNKLDLAGATGGRRPQGLCTSATAGTGLAELEAAIADRLVPRAPAPSQAVPFTARHVDCLERAAAALEHADVAAARRALGRLSIAGGC